MKLKFKILIIMIMFIIASPFDPNEKVRYPKMIVFDVERTLWPSWYRRSMVPPFYKNQTDKSITDSNGKKFYCFPNATTVLEIMYYNRFPMSIVLNTTNSLEVNRLIKLLEWDHYFESRQFFPGNYQHHVEKISRETNISLNEILFFGSDRYRIVKHLGVETIHLNQGIDLKELLHGMRRFSKNWNLINRKYVTTTVVNNLSNNNSSKIDKINS